jgi:hypothetical protein
VPSAGDLDTAASEYQAYYGLTFSKEMPLLRALISRLDCPAGHRAANQRCDTSVRRPRATGVVCWMTLAKAWPAREPSGKQPTTSQLSRRHEILLTALCLAVTRFDR